MGSGRPMLVVFVLIKSFPCSTLMGNRGRSHIIPGLGVEMMTRGYSHGRCALGVSKVGPHVSTITTTRTGWNHTHICVTSWCTNEPLSLS